LRGYTTPLSPQDFISRIYGLAGLGFIGKNNLKTKMKGYCSSHLRAGKNPSWGVKGTILLNSHVPEKLAGSQKKTAWSLTSHIANVHLKGGGKGLSSQKGETRIIWKGMATENYRQN